MKGTTGVSKPAQVVLLLKKIWLLQKRKPWVTLFEIVFPVFFAAVLLFLRMGIAIEKKESTTYNGTILSDYAFPGSETHETLIIAYTPYTRKTEDIMNKVTRKFEHALNITAIPFNSEDEMLDFVTKQNRTNCSILGGIAFLMLTKEGKSNQSKLFPEVISYKIRLKSTADKPWKTTERFPFVNTLRPRASDSPPDYWQTGFITLQYALDISIIEAVQKNATAFLTNLTTTLKRMPHAFYSHDVFVNMIESRLALFIVFSLLFNTFHITRAVVYEKEKLLKDCLNMVGVSSTLQWLSWFIKDFVYYAIIMGILTALFKLDAGDVSILTKTSGILTYLLLVLYGIATTWFCFAASAFFQKADVAAIITSIVFLLTYVPYIYIEHARSYDTMTTTEKFAACLLPNIALAFGTKIIGLHEAAGEGADWTNFYKPAVEDDNFTLLHVMLMFLVDSLILIVVTWYLGEVTPGPYGRAHPWYFPFTVTYWRSDPSGKDSARATDYMITEKESQFFEDVAEEQVPEIVIKKLTKNFGKKAALSGVNITIYANEIFVLYGKAKAGKSILLSIITGRMQPSSGSAIFEKYDVTKNMNAIRPKLGFCPQKNVLFDDMTVWEHMKLFTKLKGLPKKQIVAEAERWMILLNLAPERNTKASKLPDSLKRRLCMAVALLGDSKFLILDHFTTGLDPCERRKAWDVLRSAKHGRTIIIATDDIEEAEALGDRIAFMMGGRVRCCGSADFINNCYGIGYQIQVSKDIQCRIEDTSSLIKSHVPNSHLKCESPTRATFLIPKDNGKFEALFQDLDDHKPSLGVGTYDVGMNTMEEVYERLAEGGPDLFKSDPSYSSYLSTSSLKPSEQNDSEHVILEGHEKEAIPLQDLGKQPLTLVLPEGSIRESGTALFVQQVESLFMKRFLYSQRNPVFTICHILVPLLVLAIALSVHVVNRDIHNYEPLNVGMETMSKHAKVVAVVAPNATTGIDTFGHVYSREIQERGMSLVNFSSFMLDYTDLDIDSAILQEVEQVGIPDYNRHYIAGAAFGLVGNTTSYSKEMEKVELVTAYYGGEAYHSRPISINFLTNALLRTMSPENHSIEVINHPLPLSVEQKYQEQLEIAYTVAVIIVSGMAIFLGVLISPVEQENISGFKHLQFINGARPLTFWLGNFLWDLIIYMGLCFLMVLTILAFQVDAYFADYQLIGLLLLMLFHGLAVIPLMYCLSLSVETSVRVVATLVFLNLIVGIGSLTTVIFLRTSESVDQRLIGEVLDWLFLALFPQYCLGEGLLELYVNYNIKLDCQDVLHMADFVCCHGFCDDACKAYHSNPVSIYALGIGRILVFLLIQAAFYFVLLALSESGMLYRFYRGLFSSSDKNIYPMLFREQDLKVSVPEDNDVTLEEQRLTETPEYQLRQMQAVSLHRVCKEHNEFVSIDHVSLSVPKGEIFGLIGAHGAGKSTLLKLMTGALRPSAGDVYLRGRNLRRSIGKVPQRIGYCPQNDVVPGHLTGGEVLKLLGQLWGIDKEHITKVIGAMGRTLNIEDCLHKKICKYSLCAKRKLSVAISLMGDSEVVFLDDPLSGMDADSRQRVWAILQEIHARGRTIVIFSNSIEECEALCTKMAIMINGRLACLGSIEHLRNKFCNTYTILVRIRYPSKGGKPEVQPLMASLEASIPGAVLKNAYQDVLYYVVTDTSIPVAKLFCIMERLRGRFCIESFVIYKSNLQQLFLNFTRSQKPPPNLEEDMGKQFKKYCCLLW
ncbi:ATP-binding cassette sub-family A member 1 [Lingula anatina]|uniref:ATP-binding cassette sub-family A member 1 n=1 Tax=Lingula anatina TaxID=7574 RepID=A0A1S3JSE5_LINAN|nr:ATP-binding cassette sub-family A member 1 [Lingula anatina]XP_013413258.1 ATP-binding cassette sub-family A member 1 [Lingula anatina]|eukprot:XP_013413257.1 ATP-binding cassette sub-family A member 1 [Lingula anatina]